MAKHDQNIEIKIIEIAEGLLKDVDVEATCEDVFYALDGIDVHELWDRSGSTSSGYIGPGEMAVEMMEEELEHFAQEVFRLCELNMHREAMLHCMGVLKGIYRYNHESRSEFKDWATDIPAECFGYLLDEWRKKCQNKDELKEMNAFLKNECSKWAEWVVRP